MATLQVPHPPRPPRDTLVIAYGMTVLLIALALVGGGSIVKRATGQAALAESVVQATSVRLDLANRILGYAVAMRQSDGVGIRHLQLAMRDDDDRLQALGALDGDADAALSGGDARALDGYLSQASSALTDMKSDTATLLALDMPDAQVVDQRVSESANALAASESSYTATLAGIATIEGAAAANAATSARDDEFALAIVLVLLVAACVGLVIAPAQRRSASALEHLIRSQEQKARIGSEVAKHVADRDRRASEAQFQTLFRAASFGVALMDEDGTILETNPALQQITGYGEDELRGAKFGSWAVHRPAAAEKIELQYRRKDGSTLWAEEQVSRAFGTDGSTIVFIGLVNDVTARKQAEERLRHDATHDPLTGLQNRRVFLEAVDRTIADGAREPFAVMMIDLDRFKFVNDSRGHAFGDIVLAQIGERLRRCTRPEDTVARFGGDEFTLLTPGIHDAARALAYATRLHEAISVPMLVGDLSVRTSASIGISIWSPSIGTAEGLLRAADAAAYRAKAHGRACSIVYDVDMADRDEEKTRVGMALRTALDNGELRLAYQPIVDLRLDRCVGFEALLRWSHPELGEVSPGLFVPIAEESGLIVPIGDWVMRESIRQIATWQRQFASCDMTMNVNVSAQQLTSTTFAEHLRSVLGESAVDPRSLYFELTETAMLEGDRVSREALEAIRVSGAHLVLDDFGMGYSSLAHLTQLPIDALKIDRLFVCGSDDHIAAPEIVRALVALARSMNVDVIAEGVETSAQAADLAAMGCRYAQGYQLSRPLEASGVEAFLAGETARRADQA